MRLILTLMAFVVTSMSLSYCGFKSKRVEAHSRSPGMLPLFKDDGKTIDSLRHVYSFKEVEYENWEDDDAVDSSLTVCFINSEKLPAEDIEASVAEFNGIASSIRNAIAEPDEYKSYYIIFVKRDGDYLTTISSHRAGMDVTLTEQ